VPGLWRTGPAIKNNPQLPILRYVQIALTAQPGFNLIWQTSRAAIAPALSNALAAVSSQQSQQAGIAGDRRPRSHT
jgi:hypothetical protein